MWSVSTSAIRSLNTSVERVEIVGLFDDQEDRLFFGDGSHEIGERAPDGGQHIAGDALVAGIGDAGDGAGVVACEARQVSKRGGAAAECAGKVLEGRREIDKQ